MMTGWSSPAGDLNHDIGRLDIAMNDPELVGGIECESGIPMMRTFPAC